MWHKGRLATGFGVTAALAIALFALPDTKSHAQVAPDPNSAANPYRLDEGWAKLPPGRKWGGTFGISIDRKDRQSIWAFDRCATADFCADSDLAPIFKFDPSGKMLANFGAGRFAAPHGLFVDRDGNVWATDFRAKNGKGHTVTKFSPDGKVLMTLGKPGVAGETEDTFNGPSSVLIAPNGDIFVGDGHGGDTNARIVKFTNDGKFIKTWGHKGSAPGEFDTPHMLAMDSAGRLFVADRVNSRIQIFDQDGKFLDQWRQFGRPSGVYIDNNDTIYVADSTSSEKTNPGFQQGIRVGSAKDGKVTAFIPETKELNALEGVGADDAGNIYGGYTNTLNFRRWVKRAPER